MMELSFEHQSSCNAPSKLIHVAVLRPAWCRFAFLSIDVKMPSSQFSLSLIFPKIVSRLLTAKTLMFLYLYDTAVSPPPNAESSCSESNKTETQVDFPDKLDPQITIPNTQELQVILEEQISVLIPTKNLFKITWLICSNFTLFFYWNFPLLIKFVQPVCWAILNKGGQARPWFLTKKFEQ